MAHQALYREWRPKVFDEVVEQKTAVYALRQSVISGQIAHAYLFSGTRGTGKTTLAKIFARAINCLQPDNGNPCNQCVICRGMLDGSLLDVVEMDAASNNSVDNIRRICDEIVFMPSQARYKVYIIDEVHMLSTGAFNALLKTLEEPPAHAVFILATTEPHRIPATILSRCQRYEFRRLPVASMAARLAEIAAADGIDASPEALQAMASLADGAMRDAISLLDQARSSFPGRIERDDVLSLAGVVLDEFMQQMAAALLNADAPALLALVDQLVMAGRDLARFVTDLAQHFRNILVCQVSENPQQLVRASSESLASMRVLARTTSGSRLLELIRGLSALLADLRWASDSRTALEIGLIRLMQPPAAPAAAANVRVGAISQTAPESVPPIIPVMAEIRTAPASAVPAPKETQTIIDIPRVAPTISRSPDARMTAPAPEAPKAAPAPEAASLPAAQAVTSLPDATSVWQRILDELADQGHMTLYLFSRSARPSLQDDVLALQFDAADQINYRETAQPAALKILRGVAAKVSGRGIEVKACLADDRARASGSGIADEAEDWVSKIRKTADTMGIPVNMEE
jgi:DNA polymerase III subunit gamma/tau